MANYKYEYDGTDFKVLRFGTPEGETEKEWLVQYDDKGEPLRKVPDGRNMRGERIKQETRIRDRQGITDAMSRARGDYKRGAEAQQRSRDAASMPFYEKFPRLAKREAGKFVSGTADLVDMGLETIGFDSATDRRERRAEEQAENDIQAKELMEENPITNFLAQSAVGFGSGSLLATPAKIAASKIMPQLSKLPGMIPKSKVRPNFPPTASPRLAGAGTDLAESAIIGLGEGAGHYNQSALDGLFSSVFGTGVGKAVQGSAKPTPNFWTPTQKTELDYLIDRGFHPTPANLTGSRAKQSLEDNMSDGVGGDIKDYNQGIYNNIAWKSAGMNVPNKKPVTDKMINQHIKDIKFEYNNISRELGSALPSTSVKKLERITADLGENKTSTGIAASKTMEELVDEFKRLSTYGAPRGGKRKHFHLSGDDFIDLRRNAKNIQNGLYSNDPALQNQYLKEPIRDFLKMLEDGVGTSSMTIPQSKVKYKKYKDLNSKLSTSDLLYRNRDADGNIDLVGLRKSMQDSDSNITSSTGNTDRRRGEIKRLADADHMLKTGGKRTNESGVPLRNRKGAGNAGKLASKFVPFFENAYFSPTISRHSMLNFPKDIQPSVYRAAAVGGSEEDTSNPMKRTKDNLLNYFQ